MKKLHDAEVKNKIVLVRCDFNVSVKDGEVVDDFRITEAMPTIKDLVKRGAKVVLMSHMGRPENQKSFKKEGTFSSLKDIIFKEDRENSLKPVYKELDMLLDKAFFVNDCIGKRVDRKVKNLNPGEVLLLENLRYYEDEEEGGEEFSRRLASVADIYVNNAFSASHRDHASISGVANLLPSYPGYLFEREVKFLNKLKKDPESPFVVIVGGAKVSSKAKTIEHFMKKADKILVGGKVANAILTIRGLTKKSDLPEKDVEEKLENINLTSQKLYLPVDVVASSDYESYIRHTSVGEVRKEEDIFDIGPETVELFNKIIREAKTIVWAGPLGFFENEKFQNGTNSIAKRMVENDKALKVIGGGDTGFALKKFGLRDYVDHVSLGGGAMLTFLSDEKMPGLDCLK
ncbi:MAG: phosphoglycerate kinase [Patescibacteria group bacterium]